MDIISGSPKVWKSVAMPNRPFSEQTSRVVIPSRLLLALRAERERDGRMRKCRHSNERGIVSVLLPRFSALLPHLTRRRAWNSASRKLGLVVKVKYSLVCHCEDHMHTTLHKILVNKNPIVTFLGNNAISGCKKDEMHCYLGYTVSAIRSQMKESRKKPQIVGAVFGGKPQPTQPRLYTVYFYLLKVVVC